MSPNAKKLLPAPVHHELFTNEHKITVIERIATHIPVLSFKAHEEVHILNIESDEIYKRCNA